MSAPAVGPASFARRAGAGLVRAGAWFALFNLLQIGGVLLLSGMPLRFQGKTQLLASALTLFAAVTAGLLMLRYDRRPLRSLGFALDRRAVPGLLSGGAAGAAGLLVALVPMAAIGALRYDGDSGTVGAYATTLTEDFGVLGVAAAAEEAVFRGYAFQVLATAIHPVAATVAGSAAFMWAHSRNPNVDAIAFANIFLAGVLLSVAFLRSGSLWFATGVHVGWNWAMASLADLPVSGLEYFDTPLYEPGLYGAQWLTGGRFGPEGGLGGTIGFAVALTLVVLMTGRTTRPEQGAEQTWGQWKK